VHDVIIHHIKELIFGNRCITVHDISSNSDISIQNVEAIAHECLLFKKVCACWVTKMFEQKVQGVAVTAKHLHPFEFRRKHSRENSDIWHHKGSPPKKIQDRSVNWQDRAMCVFVSRRSDSC
jgi:hypothetical protein